MVLLLSRYREILEIKVVEADSYTTQHLKTRLQKHIALNYLSLIGKKYLESSVDDLLIESGVYAAGSTSALMKGKSYNRGIRGYVSSHVDVISRMVLPL